VTDNGLHPASLSASYAEVEALLQSLRGLPPEDGLYVPSEAIADTEAAVAVLKAAGIAAPKILPLHDEEAMLVWDGVAGRIYMTVSASDGVVRGTALVGGKAADFDLSTPSGLAALSRSIATQALS
jgi:hypothetical protein